MRLSEKILKALNDKGAGLGNASIHIIDSVLSDEISYSMTPAEWLARKYGQHLPDLPIGKVLQEMEAYAAHVARLESRDVRHQAAEIVIGYHDDGLTFLVEAIHRDIMNIPFPARPDGEKHEPPC